MYVCKYACMHACMSRHITSATLRVLTYQGLERLAVGLHQLTRNSTVRGTLGVLWGYSGGTLEYSRTRDWNGWPLGSISFSFAPHTRNCTCEKVLLKYPL